MDSADDEEEEVIAGKEVVVEKDEEGEEVVVEPVNLVEHLQDQQQQQNYANVLLEHEREQFINEWMNLPVLQTAAVGNHVEQIGE